MEPDSPKDKHIREVYEAQIRECFGRVAYSHKTHEKQADDLLGVLSRLKMWQIVLSTIVTGTLVANIFGDNTYAKIGVAVLSATLTLINTYFKNYDLGQLGQKHKDAADKLWNVRESYISLIADIVAVNTTPDRIVERRDELQKQLAVIYASAPRTNSASYQQAQTALQQNEDLTFSEAEIDAFLPDSLKKSSRREQISKPNGL